MITKKIQIFIFLISIVIHLFFYISANYTHSFDIFFEHVTRGQDFFQIPNAAYAFIHGGDLNGNLPQGTIAYTDCCAVNSNIYHPLFTLAVGVPLQFFKPWVAFGIWEIFHLLISIILVIFLWKKFSNHNNIFLYLSFYLIFSYHYYEIQHAQYNFLLNFFTVLFLYESIKNGDTKRSGLWLFLGLLVKPIGLLWILPLIMFRRFKTIIVGIGLFMLATIPFLISGTGNYYINNLIHAANLQFATYNLYALTDIVPVNSELIKITAIISAIFLVMFQIYIKPKFFPIIFLWISYQLIFYSLVFHYQYSILAGIISLGLLLNLFNLKDTFVNISIVIMMLPTPIILFHLLGDPAILPKQHLSLIALWSILWLSIICISLINLSIKDEKLKYN